MSKKLLYDASCPMCSAAASWLGPRTNIELTDLQSWQPSPPQTPTTLKTPQPTTPQTSTPHLAQQAHYTPSDEDLLREIHLVDEQGNYWAGAPALALALQESSMPIWRGVGRAMNWPLLRPMAQFGYRLVAKNRRRVAT